MANCIHHECSLNMKRSLNLIVCSLNFVCFLRSVVAAVTWWCLRLWNVMCCISCCRRCDYWHKNTFFHHCSSEWSRCRANYTFVFFRDVVMIFVSLKCRNSWSFSHVIKLSSSCFLTYVRCTAVYVVSEMCLS